MWSGGLRRHFARVSLQALRCGPCSAGHACRRCRASRPRPHPSALTPRGPERVAGAQCERAKTARKDSQRSQRPGASLGPYRRDVRVRDAVQRQYLHNCKLQYLYNSTAQESVKCFHRMVVMAPWRREQGDPGGYAAIGISLALMSKSGYQRLKMLANSPSLNLSLFVENQSGLGTEQMHPSWLCWQ